MSAPLAVNTADGTCWTRRAVTRGGLALYAPEGVCNCPPFVMATLPELAEHGIQGSADALPMPAGPEPKESGPRSFALAGEVVADDYDDAVYAAEQAYSGMRGQGYKGSVSVDIGAGVSEAELDAAFNELRASLRLRLALASAQRGRRELRAELHAAQAHGRTFLEQRNAHAAELLELRPQLESARALGRRVIHAEQRRAELEAVIETHRQDDAARIDRLTASLREATEQIARLESDLGGATARVAELEAEAATQRRKGYQVAIDVMRQEKLPMSVELLEAQLELEALDTPAPEKRPAGGYPPALPWARLMDDEDLSDFLDDLAAAAGTSGSYEGALATVENAIAQWRLIGEAQHAHNTAPGPDAEAGEPS